MNASELCSRVWCTVRVGFSGLPLFLVLVFLLLLVLVPLFGHAACACAFAAAWRVRNWTVLVVNWGSRDKCALATMCS